MKSITATERTAILVCLCAVFGIVIADVFGGFVAMRFFQFSVGMSCIFGAFCAVSDGISRLQHRAEIRKRKLVRLDRTNERLRVIHAESGGNFFHVDTRTGTAEAYFRPAAPRRVSFHGGNGSGPGIDAEAIPNALEVIGDIERGLICGGTRSGKTWLSKHLAARKLSEGGRVIAIDPKHQTGAEPWPAGTVVSGAGFDAVAILRTFDAVDAEADRRGRNLDSIRDYPPISVFVDEINALLSIEPEIGPRYVHVLRVYAQYRIGIFAMGQSANASAVGLAGQADLKFCFDAVVHARRDRRAGTYATLVDFQDGQPPILCAPPSTPLTGIGPAGGYQHRRDDGFVDVDPEDVTERANGNAGTAPPRRVAGLLSMFRRPDMSEARERIFEALYRSGRPLRPKEIESETGLQGGFIRKTLREMEGAGIVKRPGRGRYSL